MRKLQEIQKAKRESLLATEAATNKLKAQNEEFKEGEHSSSPSRHQLSHGDRFDCDLEPQLSSED